MPKAVRRITELACGVVVLGALVNGCGLDVRDEGVWRTVPVGVRVMSAGSTQRYLEHATVIGGTATDLRLSLSIVQDRGCLIRGTTSSALGFCDLFLLQLEPDLLSPRVWVVRRLGSEEWGGCTATDDGGCILAASLEPAVFAYKAFLEPWTRGVGSGVDLRRRFRRECDMGPQALVEGRSPRIDVVSNNGGVTKISNDAYLALTKARMVAADLDLPVRF